MPDKKSNYYLVLLPFLLFYVVIKPVEAQGLSNLEVFYRLSDSVIVSLIKHLPAGSNNIYMKASLPGAYSVFENRMISLLKESNLKVSTANITSATDDSDAFVNISIDNAKVNYPDIFRDGLFGGYLVKREIMLHGSYVIAEKGIVQDSKNFNFIHIDTVAQNNIKEVENPVFPFTRGDPPSEPVFSTILEPVIALGTVAAVIYLFFSVRSK